MCFLQPEESESNCTSSKWKWRSMKWFLHLRVAILYGLPVKGELLIIVAQALYKGFLGPIYSPSNDIIPCM